MTQNEYYVYIYLREDGTPYYVGKGLGRRAFRNSGRRMKKPSDETKIVFHSENLTEDEAFALERELIKKYGRKDNGTGILRNLTDGGEGTSGSIWSSDSKKKQSERQKKCITPEYRENHSRIMKEVNKRPGFFEKMSKAMKDVRSKPEVNAKIAKTMSTSEYKEKHSIIMKEILNRPEVKAKISEKNLKTKGTPEYKEKMSKIAKEIWNRPEMREKRSASLKKYYARKRAEKLQESADLTEFFISDPVSD